MILLARSFAKSLVLTRLPEFVQPAGARALAIADRFLSRFQKVKILPTTTRMTLARPVQAVRDSTPCGHGRIPQQLPRSKTH